MKEIQISTINGIIKENVYTLDEISTIMQKIELSTVRKRGKSKVSYLKDFMTFDIETTTEIDCDTPYGYMYHWQASIFGNVIFGRTWEEFIEFMTMLTKKLGLTYYKRLVVYVHYLPFEFMFIKDFFEISEMFAREKRKPLRFAGCLKDVPGSAFEFRCSFILSNMSLKKFCENSKLCVHSKLNGEDYDYRKRRTPCTELTEMELSYCYNDVAGLRECIQSIMTDYGDNLATIPMTSTGYVRRDMRSACYADPDYRGIFEMLALTLPQYNLLRAAFRGGNCHASRFYANAIIQNVDSFDRTSAYIYEIVNGLYPMSPFHDYEPDNFSDLLCGCAKKAIVMEVTFYNLRLRDDVPVPYIDFGHCTYCGNEFGNDNGRVLYANELTYVCVDIDFTIICNQYTFDKIEWVQGYAADVKAKLPKVLRQEVLKWYDLKTLLKGVDGREYEYAKSKNKLNSTFGMMVTAIINDLIEFDGDWLTGEVDEQAELEQFYSSRNSFLAYQWGVYVTANARKSLQQGIDSCDITTFLYTDTDSVKCFASDSIKQSFESINGYILTLNNDVRLYSEREGKRFYLGTWEHDGHYREFKTLGAKKYAYQTDGGDYHVTVSGLSKKKGAKEIERCGGLKEFKIGKVFTDSGRTASYFNDENIHRIKIGNDEFTTASNIGIVDTTYTLGITDEYAELIGVDLEYF